MFSHMPTYFGTAITPDLHTVVIAALLRQGYVPLALEWIRQIPMITPQTGPTLDHFHTFLKGCPHHLSIHFLRDVVIQKMHRAGCRPDNETFSILARCIVNNAVRSKTILRPETFSTLIADMKTHRLSSDHSLLSFISDYYIEIGFQVYANDIRKIYAAQFPDVLTAEEQQMNAWKKQLTTASQTSGVESAVNVFRGLASEGCPASPEIFRAILGPSKTIQDLRMVEEALGMQADASEYAVLVNNNIWVKRVADALAVYEEAKKSGVVPVAGLVAPLIRSLSSHQDKTPSVHNANLDAALALYADVDAAFPVPLPDSPEASAVNNYGEHSKGPDIDIYTSLLRGLSLSSNIKTAYPIAEALFFDLQSRGIRLTTALKISHIILEMRNCDNLDNTFKTYRKRRSDLNEHGYLVVLHAFSRMSLSMGHPDSLQYYFQIVEDMRLAGFRMSDRRDPTPPLPSDMFLDLEAATRQVHDLMSLDKAVLPESVVWNQLMDTYQRMGAFADAYRVWETLYLSGAYGPVAVSIILDACGHAGEYDIAKAITDKLFADHYVFNLHNWNSWVECLCRLDRMSDALKAVCSDMGSVGQKVKPNGKTIEILLEAAETQMQRNIILQRIKRFLPELWESL
ncbi:hypothetical protein B0H10DRAFT_1875277, partial [Mycena sp. CBHHK59/15]